MQGILGIHLSDVMALRATSPSLRVRVSLQNSAVISLLKERSQFAFPTPGPLSRREGGDLNSPLGQTLLCPQPQREEKIHFHRSLISDPLISCARICLP